MNEAPTYEETIERREAVEEEAARLYREDALVRRICDSLVVEAMETIGHEYQERSANAVQRAVMMAIAMVAGKGAEANFIMRERDMYRDKIMMELARLSSGIPVYHTTDATDEFVKPD